jgi:hypothetical protein
VSDHTPKPPEEQPASTSTGWRDYTPVPQRSSPLRELRRAHRLGLASAVAILALLAVIAAAVVLTTRGIGTTPQGACSPAPCADDGNNLRLFVDGVSVLPAAGGDTPAGAPPTLVQVTLHVVNASQAARAVNALDLSLRDASGITHGLLQVAGAQCGVFEAVQLAPGSTLGPKAICFPAPASPGTHLTLVWSPGTRSIDLAVTPH